MNVEEFGAQRDLVQMLERQADAGVENRSYGQGLLASLDEP